MQGARFDESPKRRESFCLQCGEGNGSACVHYLHIVNKLYQLRMRWFFSVTQPSTANRYDMQGLNSNRTLSTLASHGDYGSFSLLPQASAGYFTEVLSDGSTVQVEVIAAADLSMGSKSLPVPYCALATGYRGQPWAAKASGKPECNTPPALRQRHPRWNALCKLQLPKAYVSPSRVEFCKDDSAPQEIELSVRVMDAGGLRGDRMAGEARIPLSQARGAGTFRLLGGGYASLSVRWSEVRGFGAAQEPSEPSDFAEFEEAMCFWSRQDLATPTGVQRAQRELQTKLAAADRNLVNELLLQTPLCHDSSRYTTLCSPSSVVHTMGLQRSGCRIG